MSVIKYNDVVKPFLIGDELVGNKDSQPKRFVIDFTGMDIIKASTYKDAFDYLKINVLPEIEAKAELEKTGKSKANGREAWLKSWWLMWRRREDLLYALKTQKRYISCSRVGLRPIFQFVSSDIRPNDALMIFSFDDDYSYGIIQSKFHWKWYVEKCSTLEGRYRYTADSVWDTFPWPQKPTIKQIEKVASAGIALRDARNKIMKDYNMTLRDIYRSLEQPGKNTIKDLQNALDKAVMEAYSFNENEDLLAQLLALNLAVSEKENINEKVQGPGLPSFIKDKTPFVSEDCVKFFV